MDKKKIAKVTTFRYQILALIFIVLAGGLVLLPKYQKQEGIKSEVLLSHATSPERYISTDQIANKIINQDPSFILIDVRDEGSYNNYSLPNAINIPHTAILANVELLNLFEGRDMIFYCRSGARASWVTDYLIKKNTLSGATIYHLDGDMKGWRSAGLPIEK